ncbi:AP-3 complex subunit beta, partial [Ceratobasidium sp. 395]
MALSSIQENASRLGMRIQESLSEHTRDIALVGRSANASYFDSAEDKIKQISSQLASNSDRDKLDAMKRLIALVSKGRNVSEFFAQVVLNVASPNLEIRKLVYIYLIRHAASEPDLTLLSINTFQKDLADPNPLIRAMALRVLSAIGVPMTGNVVAMGVKKCAADPSPYVRKAAALAIPKCYALDTSHHASLLATLNLLLKNHSPLSVGAVARAFTLLCPNRLDLLHPHYRRLCRVLVDADEWGQVELLDLLSRYARSMLSKPVEGLKELAEPSQPKDNIE